MARARVFDIDEAIATATNLFWRNGYERTSLADLTAAMKITPPSFYFAFGSKEGLFKRVLDHYVETRLGRAQEALRQPTARGVAEAMLSLLADLYTDEYQSLPRGCLAVKCTLQAADGDGPVQAEAARHREARWQKLRDRFQEAKDAGDLPPTADPGVLARYLMVVGWGLACAAQSGATRAELHRTVACALQGWPS